MLFSSISFLYYFLPIVIILYFIVPKKLKNLVLLVSSLFFYFWGEPKYAILMVISAFIGYIFGFFIEKTKSGRHGKLVLGAGITIIIGLLGFFKYTDFFIININGILGTDIALLKLVLPIGISFYSFQILSYLVDVYRSEAALQKNFLDFATYVTLFPQLIAGPIVRYTTVQDELKNRTHSFENFSYGVRRFVIGLAKKIFIANTLAQLVSYFNSANEKTVLFYWIAAVAYMLQIYFDFGGYSDMAIGLGRMFGFHFCENFDYPYISRSITEFWRRWHMSLGSWFRDYVYIPLGGNRVGKVRWIFNIFVVWALTGFWHGSEWNFVVWGLYFGVLLAIEKLFLGKAIKKMPGFLQNTYVVFIILISFVIFGANSMPEALKQLQGMFGGLGLPGSNDLTVYYLRSYGFTIIAGIICATPLLKTVYNKMHTNQTCAKVLDILEPVTTIVLMVMITANLINGSFNPFIYFRF